VTFQLEKLPNERWPHHAAALVTRALEGVQSLVLTGGTTAEKIYHPLAEAGAGLSDVEIFFSDERCVPPKDDRSNFGMVKRILFAEQPLEKVHRMRGEDDPNEAAESYSQEIAPFVARGIDLALVGMGADCHVCGLFPKSPALGAVKNCSNVARPDGMMGLTLTPPAITSAKKVLLICSGESKAEAVKRTVHGNEPPTACPARIFADHPDATFVLDEDAASAL
jgi:6-phosphogluconolactonase